MAMCSLIFNKYLFSINRYINQAGQGCGQCSVTRDTFFLVPTNFLQLGSKPLTCVPAQCPQCPASVVTSSRFYLSHSVTVGSVCFAVWGMLETWEWDTSQCQQQDNNQSAVRDVQCSVQQQQHRTRCWLWRGVHCLTVNRKILWGHDVIKTWQWPVRIVH